MNKLLLMSLILVSGCYYPGLYRDKPYPQAASFQVELFDCRLEVCDSGTFFCDKKVCKGAGVLLRKFPGTARGMAHACWEAHKRELVMDYTQEVEVILTSQDQTRKIFNCPKKLQ